MAIPEITQKLLAAKKAKGLTFADLEKIVGRDEVWISAVFIVKPVLLKMRQVNSSMP
jgi:cyanate lyase